MMRIVFFLGLVTLALALDLDLDVQWMSFQKTYTKDYHETEELVRKIIFKENVAYIQKHNLQADMGMHTYWLGVNEYTDWSHEGFVKHMNGINLNQNTTKTRSCTFQEPKYLVLPGTVDWRPKGYVTEVKNQQQCGSCWAFSATGALEGQHFKVKGKLVSLSEQNLVDCSKSEGNYGCHGGLPSNAFDYVRLNAGIDTEACYPYEGKDGVCRYKSNCTGSTCVGYQDIPHGNETALQVAVATVGPISVAIDASHKSFQLYKSGIYNEPNCSTTHLDHGVLAVGYGTNQGQPYWLVKNSWGTSWGLQGYVMMTRNKNNQCGISTMATYPWVM